ncbi:MAG: non-homologous end-joining DNA ligase [Candidatus Bathyarchaeota archaeon]|nr:non-homologous end-joining DNA ligase [Candidatus Bathyarchaeota archaeon]
MNKLEEAEKLTKVKFKNLNKIFYPNQKVTKAQVIEHYIKLAPKILPIIKDRPLVLTRYPDGIEGKTAFYEKNAPEGTPSWIKTLPIYSETSKREIDYIICNDLDTLIWLANLAALEIHMPFCKVNALDKPDFLFFDLDPEPPATLNDAVEVALLLRDMLVDLGLTSFVKTSGKKGLHVVVPIAPEYTFEQTRTYVHNMGIELAKKSVMVVSEFKDTKKPGKIFVDYLQNSPLRTMVIPYSLRATPEASVSTPLEWLEVRKGINPSDYTIFTVDKRKENPWKNIFDLRCKLEINYGETRNK